MFFMMLIDARFHGHDDYFVPRTFFNDLLKDTQVRAIRLPFWLIFYEFIKR